MRREGIDPGGGWMEEGRGIEVKMGGRKGASCLECFSWFI